MFNKTIEIERKSDGILVVTRTSGISIIGYWEVAIETKYLIKYVDTYNSSALEGFLEHDGFVFLSHKDCKIRFEKSEAKNLINLIRRSFMWKQVKGNNGLIHFNYIKVYLGNSKWDVLK